ncbi:hypothetical protein [Kordiimonas sp.]|uniref:hypothetical protein n=1 Tax=Kordiimonas sp. TaxID=1970157 RepID=UPI003A8D642C
MPFSDDDPAMLADEVRQVLHNVLDPSIEIVESVERPLTPTEAAMVLVDDELFPHEILSPFVWVGDFGLARASGGRFVVHCGFFLSSDDNDDSWQVSPPFGDLTDATIHAVGCLIRDSLGY